MKFKIQYGDLQAKVQVYGQPPSAVCGDCLEGQRPSKYRGYG